MAVFSYSLVGFKSSTLFIKCYREILPSISGDFELPGVKRTSS